MPVNPTTTQPPQRPFRNAPNNSLPAPNTRPALPAPPVNNPQSPQQSQIVARYAHPNRVDFCFYHRKWGKEAFRCQPPCTWRGPLPPQSTQMARRDNLSYRPNFRPNNFQPRPNTNNFQARPANFQPRYPNQANYYSPRPQAPQQGNTNNNSLN